MKPKWQRARLLTDFRVKGRERIGRGSLVWVQIEPPRMIGGSTIAGTRSNPELCYQTNILKPADATETIPNIAAQTHGLELLPYFSDDVDLVPWEQFLAECRQAPVAESKEE